jgi:hypothetical protein
VDVNLQVVGAQDGIGAGKVNSARGIAAVKQGPKEGGKPQLFGVYRELYPVREAKRRERGASTGDAVSFCEVSFAGRGAHLIRVERGTLRFEGGIDDISAGRFRDRANSDERFLPAAEGILGVRVKDFSGMSCEKMRSMIECQLKPGEA